MGRSLDELASYFRPQAEALLQEATNQGLDPVVEDTGRSVTEQQVKILTGVSWTQNSRHLPQPPEGLSEAIDIVPRACMSVKYWGWNGKLENSHPYWTKLIDIAKGLGLTCGVYFPHPDPGHFQFTRTSTQV